MTPSPKKKEKKQVVEIHIYVHQVPPPYNYPVAPTPNTYPPYYPPNPPIVTCGNNPNGGTFGVTG